MKIQILSDIHHEFYQNLDFPFIDSMNLSNVDAVVLAGDICSFIHLKKVLERYAQKGRDFIYVAGNHEYYLGGRFEVWSALNELSIKYPNFHWLNNDVCIINGQRFIGGTLWYPNTPDAILAYKNWSDFGRILDKPEQWIWQEAIISKQFLTANVEKNDIVVTHMLPSWQSVSPRYRNANTNCFFVHDCEQLIQNIQPKLWIHGHTHCSMDYKINNTRIIANPRGYPTHNKNVYENFSWQQQLVIEI